VRSAVRARRTRGLLRGARGESNDGRDPLISGGREREGVSQRGPQVGVREVSKQARV
jgi:hypothetical protein